MAITLDRLTETYHKFKHKYEGVKQDYFAPIFISDKFEKPIEDVLEYCAFGKNDYGIDAYYIHKEAKNLYLYQFKWSENYELFKESYKRLISCGMEKVFGNSFVDSSINNMILKLKYDLEEYKDLINKVYICFVFNGDPEKAESSRVLESLREELESKKYLIDNYFKNSEITLTIQYISNQTKQTNQISRTKRTFQYDICFRGTFSKRAIGNEVLYLGIMSIYDLYKMFVDMGQRFFEKNIRSGLSAHLPPNQAIKKSLKNIVIDKKISPEYFTFHHNGITLFVEKLYEENEIIKIIEPRVLNGAQTITTFSRFIDEIQNHLKYEECEAVLRQIEVITRIITDCSKEFVTQVTISNNKQNPVEPWNLRANDLIQLEFEDKFRQSGIFYERQENFFANFRESDLEELGIKCQKELKITKLAQTFLAIQGEIDKISDIRNVFEVDSLYEKTFQPNFLKSDTRKIILAYKIQFRLSAIIREIESKGEKYFFVRHARNLIWALTIQGLLNDKHIENILENYGNSLTVEADFNSSVKNLGSGKIRIILSELIKKPEYEDYIKNEKFSFLKTRGAFNDCLRIAKEKYSWEMQKIH